MDPFYYLIEIIAIIAGILLVLAPLVFRFFRGTRREAKVRRAAAERVETMDTQGETAAPASPPEEGGEIQVLPRSKKIDNYIRRVQEAGMASEDSGTGESWPPKAALADRVRTGEPAGEEGIVAMPALIATKYMESYEQAAESGGWRRINGLPPLQRAIILQALLGPPKGIKEVWFDG